MLTLPAKVRRKKQPYLYIRSKLSRRNLRKQAILFFGEIRQFMEERGIELTGPGFMRYRAVERNGDLDIEFGYFTDRLHPVAGPVRSGILPAGTFVSVQWTGPFEHLPDVNAMLSGWAAHNGVEWAATETPGGTEFGCRLEIYHVSSRHVSDARAFRTEIAMMTRSPGEQLASESAQLGAPSAPSLSHFAMASCRNE
jgi:effector-binding domain-containing protein